jgi:hypothetical protein
MNIGGLTIEMAADLARLRQDMDDAKKLVNTSMAEIQRAVDLAKRAFVGLVGVGSVAAFAGMIKSSLDASAALHDLSIQTGASVAALGAFKGLGAYTETSIDTIVGAMGKLAKSMGTADEDSKGAAVALKALGINFNDFKRLSPEKQMLTVAKAMGGFKDGAEKSAAAQALFGKEGAKLLPFLADLADQADEVTAGLTDQQKAARDLQAAQADAFGDNLTALRKNSEGWKKDLATGLTPALFEMSQAVLDVTGGSGGLKEEIKKLAKDGTFAEWARGAFTALTYLLDVGQGLYSLLPMLGKLIAGIAAGTSVLFGGIYEAVLKLKSGDMAGAWEGLKKGFSGVAVVASETGSDISAIWGQQLMGEKLRARMADLKDVQAAAKDAKKDLDIRAELDKAAEAEKRKTEAEKAAAEAARKAQELRDRQIKGGAEFVSKILQASEAMQMQADVGRELTESEKMGLELTHQLAEGKISLTDAEQKHARSLLDDNRSLEANVAWMRESAKENDAAAQARTSQLDSLDDQIAKQREANDLIGLSAAQVHLLEIAKLRDAAADKERLASLAESVDLSGQMSNDYREQAKRLNELADLKAKGGSKSADDYVNSGIGQDMAAGFDAASQSLGVFVQGFSKLVDEQRRYGEEKKAAAGNAAQLAKVEAHHQAAQLNGYAALAGAAKGFFGTKTAGYKGMALTEQVLRAAELAGAIETAVIKSGLMDAEVAQKVGADGVKAASESGYSLFSIAQSGLRTAAKAVEAAVSSMAGLPFPLNLAALGATVAALGALGVSVFGGGGSHGSLPQNNNDGTGTVLGDKSAKSESITKGLEALKEVDKMTMRYSASMAASLTAIEGNIGSMATLLVQSGTLQASGSNIKTGTTKSWFNSTTAGTVTGVLDVLTFGLFNGLHDKIGSIIGNLFGSSKTEIVGQGITAAAQQVATIVSKGFSASYFNDIKETSSSFWGLSKSTTYSTQYTDADAEFKRQVGTLIGNYSDALKAAAGPLGLNLKTVTDKVNSFVVDIGRIDLQGLSGTQIQDKLTAVFSALGDKMASGVLGGLEGFQHVGEGYLQTVIRVASGTEQAQAALKKLGITAISLAKITNKQGDVAAEQVRQSLIQAETDRATTKVVHKLMFFGIQFGKWTETIVDQTALGIANIMSGLTGTADELASTYKALTDVRTSLNLLGLDGRAVSYALIEGAGGLQQLSDSMAAFEQGFLSDTQRASLKANTMNAEFAKLGLTMPKTAEGFVSLVKGIDTSTDAGRQLLGSLLGLSSGFAGLLDAVKGLGSGIADEIAKIESATGTSTASLAELQTNFAVSTAQARSGDQKAIDALPQIADALLKAAEATASSSLDYSLIQAQTLASLKATLAQIDDPSKLLGKVPGFADGGYFGGGLRLVGESGPELEVTGPSRIFSAAQTSQILNGSGGGDGLQELMQAVLDELVGLRQQQTIESVTLARNTGKTAALLERAMPNGNAISTVAAT